VGPSFTNRKGLIRKNFGFLFQTVKKTIILFTIIIVTISFILFFYFQYQTEQSIKENILAQQIQNQKEATKLLAQIIHSDLDSVMARLQGLATSTFLQSQHFQLNDTKSFIQNYFHQINSTSPVDRLFIIDANGITRTDVVSKGQSSYVGMNFSNREWIKNTKDTLQPQFSDGFVGKDSQYRIVVTYPITIKSSFGSTNYGGLVGVAIPTIELFSYYGNICGIQLKYLSVLGSKGVLLVHPIASLIGKSFYGDNFQKLFKRNRVLNNIFNVTVASGKPSLGIYDFGNGQTLTTGYPIIISEKNQYSVFVITPASNDIF